MAPELLLNEKEKVTPKADIFSLGATLLEIAAGINLPQNGMMWHKLREGDIKFSPSANRSQQLEELINSMMDPDLEARPAADDILLHPVLQMKLQRRMQAAKIRKDLNLHHSPFVSKMKQGTLHTQINRNNIETIYISPRILNSARQNMPKGSHCDFTDSSDEEMEDASSQYLIPGAAKKKNKRTIGRTDSFSMVDEPPSATFNEEEMDNSPPLRLKSAKQLLFEEVDSTPKPFHVQPIEEEEEMLMDEMETDVQIGKPGFGLQNRLNMLQREFSFNFNENTNPNSQGSSFGGAEGEIRVPFSQQ